MRLRPRRPAGVYTERCPPPSMSSRRVTQYGLPLTPRGEHVDIGPPAVRGWVPTTHTGSSAPPREVWGAPTVAPPVFNAEGKDRLLPGLAGSGLPLFAASGVLATICTLGLMGTGTGYFIQKSLRDTTGRDTRTRAAASGDGSGQTRGARRAHGPPVRGSTDLRVDDGRDVGRDVPHATALKRGCSVARAQKKTHPFFFSLCHGQFLRRAASALDRCPGG